MSSELETLKTNYERVERMYLEMRDGHEHVVHQMSKEIEQERARSANLLEALKHISSMDGRNSGCTYCAQAAREAIAEWESK